MSRSVLIYTCKNVHVKHSNLNSTVMPKPDPCLQGFASNSHKYAILHSCTLHIHTHTQTNCLHFFLITQTARIAFMIVAVPSCPWREPTGTHWPPWRFWNGHQGCLPLHGPYDQNQPPEPHRSPETFSNSIRHIFSIHTLEKKHEANCSCLHAACDYNLRLSQWFRKSACHTTSVPEELCTDYQKHLFFHVCTTVRQRFPNNQVSMSHNIVE